MDEQQMMISEQTDQTDGIDILNDLWQREMINQQQYKLLSAALEENPITDDEIVKLIFMMFYTYQSQIINSLANGMKTNKKMCEKIPQIQMNRNAPGNLRIKDLLMYIKYMLVTQECELEE